MVILCFFIVKEATSAPSSSLLWDVLLLHIIASCLYANLRLQTRAKPAPCGAILNQRLSSLWRDKHKD